MITNKKQKKRKLQITLSLVACSFILAHLCFWLLPRVFETWNAQTFDRLFRIRSQSEYFRPLYDETILHVDLNNTSIRQLDKFYLNRSHHAQVIRNLAEMKVSAQLYDFIFAARRNEAEDTTLIKATRKAGNVYMGLAFKLAEESVRTDKKIKASKTALYLNGTEWRVIVEGNPSSFYFGTDPLATFPDLASACRGLGYISLRPDPDGVFRRLPLLVRYESVFYPSFSFRAICDYLSVPPEKIVVKPGKAIILKNARRPGERDGHDIDIPIDQYGNMVINFVGPWERMKHFNIADILLASEDRDEMEMLREDLSGKIVVVSEVSTGSIDIGPAPTDPEFPLSGIHANVLNTILTESFLRELSDHQMLMVEILLMAIVLFLSLRFSSLYFSLGSLVVACAYVGVVITGFLYGQVICHLLRPLLMVAFALFSIVVYRYFNEEREKLEGLRQRDFIRATFGRYLSDEVVDELLDTPEGLKMSGELREVTFLVSDLRGFTALSSTLSPREVIDILNRYLERMVEIIARYGGTVDELQGDGILVFFGAPLAAPDDQERAVACAIEMQNAMEEVNEEQRRLSLPELAMGIGLNGGEVVVGNLGSEKRAKYSAVGTPINIAYRIESHTVGGQVLISTGIYEKLRSLVKVRGTVEMRFKGVDHPVTLHDIAGIGGRYQLALYDSRPEVMIPLKPPVPVYCFLIKGKEVSEKDIRAEMTHLGSSSAKVSLDNQLTVHSNIKIVPIKETGAKLSELYAKVLSVDHPNYDPSKTIAGIQFTWLPEDVKAFFKKIRSQESQKE